VLVWQVAHWRVRVQSTAAASRNSAALASEKALASGSAGEFGAHHLRDSRAARRLKSAAARGGRFDERLEKPPGVWWNTVRVWLP
jgi:hypothetical protein